MPDRAPERGRFYRFMHYATERFPHLQILRVHRAQALPEGQGPPALADLHPGDAVEVAPMVVLGPGDVNPETGSVLDVATEFPVVVNHPHLVAIPPDEPVLSAYVQDASPPAPEPQPEPQPEAAPAPEPTPTEPAAPETVAESTVEGTDAP